MKIPTIILILVATILLISCQDQNGIDIDKVDLEPVIRINSPEFLTSCIAGRDIYFEAEFFTLDESLQDWTATWESDKDGILFSESLVETTISSFATSTLSDSVHTITVSFSNSNLAEPAHKHVIVENNLPEYIDYNQFTYIGYLNERQYFVSEFWESWHNADSISTTIGGHLLTITSEEENSFLEDVMYNYYTNCERDSVEASTIWLGLSYNSNMENYEWVTDEEFGYYYGDSYHSYDDFLENPSLNQPYIYINNFDREWRISDNEIQRRFILEIELGEDE